MNKKNALNHVIIENEKNRETLMTSIIIALGINIFSSGIIGLLKLETNYIFLVLLGCILSILVFLIYLILKTKASNSYIEINGLIIYDKKNKKIINVPEYPISENMTNYLSAAFSENKALAKQWKMGKLGFDFGTHTHKNKKIINNNNMILELLEYCLLDKLSISLTDYFNINNIDEKDIIELNYDKMPEKLRKNRFLKLFSEEMKNRNPFISNNPQELIDSENKKICYAIGKSGAIYRRFELSCPKETIIKKETPHSFELDMKYFTLKIEIDFEGFNAVVDNEFYDYYLNLKPDISQYTDFSFSLKISIKYKNQILFSNKKIENYLWVDKLLTDLHDYSDIDNFYQKINWEATKCFFRCYHNKKMKE